MSKNVIPYWLYAKIKENSIKEIITEIGAVLTIEDYENYTEYSLFFDKEQFLDIYKNSEKYLDAILSNDYEVEEEKTPLGWIPEEGERYWLVQNVGAVAYNLYEDYYDKNLVKYTKVFKTQEEAEFEAEKMKVTRELEKYSKEFKKGKFNFYMFFDYSDNKSKSAINFKYAQSEKQQVIYFESVEKAKEAIDAVGEDRILKYYFGVE